MSEPENASYQIVTIPVSRQALKKLPLRIRKHLISAMEILKTDPYQTEELQPPWSGFRSLHSKYQNTQYRIVYEVDKTNSRVIIRYSATRENFYRDLRHLHLKPLVKNETSG